jgi:hypothetical protein
VTVDIRKVEDKVSARYVDEGEKQAWASLGIALAIKDLAKAVENHGRQEEGKRPMCPTCDERRVYPGDYLCEDCR